MNLKTVSTLVTIAVLMVPAALLAQHKGRDKHDEPYEVEMTGVGAALKAAVGTCGNCFSISIEQDTDEADVTTTTMDLFFLSDATEIHFSGPITSYLVTPSKNALNVYFTPALDLPTGACSGACGPISLTFTKNKTYSFRRDGSVHGVCPNDVHISDTFKRTFDGADVTGVLGGNSFFSTAGQLSTFKGDPALTSEAGPAPCVLQ